jgi:hypothetical protein
LVDASLGERGCALKILSNYFGKRTGNCEACIILSLDSNKEMLQEEVIASFGEGKKKWTGNRTCPPKAVLDLSSM